jgi:hypothetical protein
MALGWIELIRALTSDVESTRLEVAALRREVKISRDAILSQTVTKSSRRADRSATRQQLLEAGIPAHEVRDLLD